VTADPFELLGVPRDATAGEIRAARRRLAKRLHPDAGGQPGSMRALNLATADALRLCVPSHERDGDTVGAQRGGEQPEESTSETAPTSTGRVSRIANDVPSFTVEALPVETFEALLVAAAVLGEVLDDDPPYRLDAVLGRPYDCWCRLDLVPDAGASSVSLTVGAFDDRPMPPMEAVRDAWIDELNALDWSRTGS
jgi:DnaJ domain